MIFSGNNIGNYNRIYAFDKLHPKPSLYYYIQANEFINNTITIPTSNSVSGSTNSSLYFAGRTTVYNINNRPCGTCGASFLNIQSSTDVNETLPSNIYTQINNNLSIDNGLILSWLTPTNPINLEIDSVLNSMITECIVTSTIKIGVNPYYGQTFNMIVANNSGKISFTLTPRELR